MCWNLLRYYILYFIDLSAYLQLGDFFLSSTTFLRMCCTPVNVQRKISHSTWRTTCGTLHCSLGTAGQRSCSWPVLPSRSVLNHPSYHYAISKQKYCDLNFNKVSPKLARGLKLLSIVPVQFHLFKWILYDAWLKINVDLYCKQRILSHIRCTLLPSLSTNKKFQHYRLGFCSLHVLCSKISI